MAQNVLLPQLGISDESAVIGEFYVKPGDTVTVGQPLFSLETGKSVFDVESEYAGQVLALFCAAGDELPIKAPVMAIGQPGEKAEAAPQPKAAPEAAAAPTAIRQEAAPAPALRPETGTEEAAKKLASPRARTLAGKAGVDVAQATPTGPEGLIIERDVKKLLDEGAASAVKAPAAKAAETPVSAADYTDMPLTTMRKTIAKNMLASLSGMAQLTHSASFDAAEILAYRAKCKQDQAMAGVTIGDMVLFAVSRTLLAFPEANAHFMGDAIRRFAGVHLAVAVDIPGGLVVPVIRDADKKSLLAISNEMKELAQKCREGTVSQQALAGGTFTVSNLGNLGVEHFTPIINPPQVGILGVNCVTLRPRRKEDGSVEFYDAMGLSLTYDHRAIDGAPASRFLQALCKNLEAFTLLLGK